MEIAFSLGSNLNDRKANLIKAREALCGLPYLRPTDHSSIYETEPVGVPAEFRNIFFLNCVVVFECVDVLFPARLEDILFATKGIESGMGRSGSAPGNVPRVVDIDILYVGTLEISRDNLVIPHPEWNNRRFVLEPLAEIRPDLILSGVSDTVSKVLKGLRGGGKVIKITDKNW